MEQKQNLWPLKRGVAPPSTVKQSSDLLADPDRGAATGADDGGEQAVARGLAGALGQRLISVGEFFVAETGEFASEFGVGLGQFGDLASVVTFDHGLDGLGAGMRRLTREHCDVLFSIPMAGEVSSLNVSVATGVTLFEALRQRRQA
jgi:hypothetical protein